MKIQNGQLYKITNDKNNKSYIGVVYSKGKTYLDRFEEHLNCKGSAWIRKDLKEGLAIPEDFSTTLLVDNITSLKVLRDLENRAIKSFNTLHPNGYNGNCGNLIVVTPEGKAQANAKIRAKILSGEICRKGMGKGRIFYRCPDGVDRALKEDHPDVLSGKAILSKTVISRCKYRTYLFKNDTERLKNNGYTDKQCAFFKRLSSVMKIRMQNPYNIKQWVNGREKFRIRMANKEFTEAELAAYATRSKTVTDNWASLTCEQKLAKSEPGNKARNSKAICIRCGIETNLGNLSRWHNDRCKSKN